MSVCFSIPRLQISCFDESLTEVLKRMGARGLYLLPVVARNNPQKVLGTIDKNQILAGDWVETQIALIPYLTGVN